MAGNYFEQLARMIEREGHPFPVSEARRLVLRATGRTQASDELAFAIDRLNAMILAPCRAARAGRC